jgi:hypothetical protein
MKPYYDKPRWTETDWLWAAIAAVCVSALLGNIAVWLLLRNSDGDPSSTSAGVQGDMCSRAVRAATAPTRWLPSRNRTSSQPSLTVVRDGNSRGSHCEPPSLPCSNGVCTSER